MTDVIRVAAEVGVRGSGPHDEPVTASPPPYPGLGLPALRRLTWSITAACLLLIAGLVTTEALTGPVRAVVVPPAVIGVCAATGLLFAGPLLGRPVLPAPRWRVTVVLTALVAAGVLALAHADGTAGFPWPLPLAAVLAAAH